MTQPTHGEAHSTPAAIAAEKVPLEGNGNLASKSPRMTTATSGNASIRDHLRGVKAYFGSVFLIVGKEEAVKQLFIRPEETPMKSRGENETTDDTSIHG